MPATFDGRSDETIRLWFRTWTGTDERHVTITDILPSGLTPTDANNGIVNG